MYYPAWTYEVADQMKSLLDEVKRLRAENLSLRQRMRGEYDPKVAPCDDAEFGMSP